MSEQDTNATTSTESAPASTSSETVTPSKISPPNLLSHAQKIKAPWFPSLNVPNAEAVDWFMNHNDTEELRYRIRRMEDDTTARGIKNFHQYMKTRREAELLTSELLVLLKRVAHGRDAMQLVSDAYTSDLFQLQLERGFASAKCQVLRCMRVTDEKRKVGPLPAVVLMVWPSQDVLSAVIAQLKTATSVTDTLVWVGFYRETVSFDEQRDTFVSHAMARLGFNQTEEFDDILNCIGQVCHVDYFRNDVIHQEARFATAEARALWETLITKRSRVLIWRKDKGDRGEESKTKKSDDDGDEKSQPSSSTTAPITPTFHYKTESSETTPAIVALLEIQDVVGCRTGVDEFIRYLRGQRLKGARLTAGFKFAERALRTIYDASVPCHVLTEFAVLAAVLAHGDLPHVDAADRKVTYGRVQGNFEKRVRVRSEASRRAQADTDPVPHTIVPQLCEQSDTRLRDPDYDTFHCNECGLYEHVGHVFLKCATCSGVFCSEFCCGQFHTA